MDEIKIPIVKNGNKNNAYPDKFIPVRLSGSNRAVKGGSVEGVLDMMQLYNSEKDKSGKYRLSFSVYPMCTNVLFNMATEVVAKEGGKMTDVDGKQIPNLIPDEGNAYNLMIRNRVIDRDRVVSKNSINRKNCIRNTEYSNPGHDIAYYCGVDIFNNHLLRSMSFSPVVKRTDRPHILGKNPYSQTYYKCDEYMMDIDPDTGIPNGSIPEKMQDTFNTIMDFDRDSRGDIRMFHPIDSSSMLYNDGYLVKKHMYGSEDVNTIDSMFKTGIKEKDGWYGFLNASTIRHDMGDKGKPYFINKCMGDAGDCDIVDFYPDRSLYSFGPKYNRYRNRYEDNWKYIITYPYANDYYGKGFLNPSVNGLPILFGKSGKPYEVYTGGNGADMARFFSPARHGLSIGDFVLLKFTSDKSVQARVTDVGNSDMDKENHYFSVRLADLDLFEEGEYPVCFARMSRGRECLYYFRKLKSVYSSVKYIGSSERFIVEDHQYKPFVVTDMYPDGIDAEEGDYGVFGGLRMMFTGGMWVILKEQPEYRSVNAREAFAETIYGDPVSSVVFTDDVDVSGLVDNLGRPVKELYLTVIKNNRGHDEWYENGGMYTDTVEFSHAFGKITSGLDLPEEAGTDTCSVRRQHCIKGNDIIGATPSSKYLEDDITVDSDSFLCDLVEFDASEFRERTVEPVYYRFNTAQREHVFDNGYGTLFDDTVLSDDDDPNGFIMAEISRYRGYANLNPEGYIYRPHFRIGIRNEKDFTETGNDMFIPLKTEMACDEKCTSVKAIALSNTNMLEGDRIVITDGRRRIEGTVRKCREGVDLVLEMDGKVPSGYLRTMKLFRKNPYIPPYAYPIPNGTGEYIWRGLKNRSESVEGENMYDVPFANGAFYVNTQVILSLKRQDPFRDYGIKVTKQGSEVILPYNIKARKDSESVFRISRFNLDTVCF